MSHKFFTLLLSLQKLDWHGLCVTSTVIHVHVQPVLPQSIKVYTYLHAGNNAVAFFSCTIQSKHDFGSTCVLFSPKGCWGPSNAYFHYTFTIWHYCESTTSSFHEESDWESGKQHWISKVLSQVLTACLLSIECCWTNSFFYTVYSESANAQHFENNAWCWLPAWQNEWLYRVLLRARFWLILKTLEIKGSKPLTDFLI